MDEVEYLRRGARTSTWCRSLVVSYEAKLRRARRELSREGGLNSATRTDRNASFDNSIQFLRHLRNPRFYRFERLNQSILLFNRHFFDILNTDLDPDYLLPPQNSVHAPRFRYEYTNSTLGISTMYAFCIAALL